MRIFLFILIMILPPGIVNSQAQNKNQDTVRNIILMIGDGMGIDQTYAAYTANKGRLNMYEAPWVGFCITYSANNYVTDSGAGATAIASGKKTNNYVIGVDTNGRPLKSILMSAEEHDLSTGLIATSSITHATPAAFFSNQSSRNYESEIAMDFLNSGIDIFIGGGKKFFEGREARTNISELLRKNENYSIVYNLKDIDPSDPNNIGCLAADESMPKKLNGRGSFLADATEIALEKLSKNNKGFFIMIEGSQIDWAGHDNDIDYMIAEVLDFDEAVGKAFRFADKNPGTLVIVTGDHETGGLALTGGNIRRGKIEAEFSTTNHTGVMVPVFAYGTGGYEFAGVYQNTEIYYKMMNLLRFSRHSAKNSK